MRPMNFQKVFVPLTGLLLLGLSYRSFGWSGVAVACTGIVMFDPAVCHLNRRESPYARLMLDSHKRSLNAGERPLFFEFPAAVLANRCALVLVPADAAARARWPANGGAGH